MKRLIGSIGQGALDVVELDDGRCGFLDEDGDVRSKLTPDEVRGLRLLLAAYLTDKGEPILAPARSTDGKRGSCVVVELPPVEIDAAQRPPMLPGGDEDEELFVGGLTADCFPVREAAPMLLVERAAIAADPDKLAAFDLVHPEIARMAREAEA